MRAGCDVGLKDSGGYTGRELAEAQGHAAVLARLRAVVAEQLRAAQGAGPALEPEPGDGGRWDDDGGRAEQLLEAALQGDGAEMARLGPGPARGG